MVEPGKRFAVALTSIGSQEQAVSLAKELVERRLAACVNILSQVHSVYRWKGKVWQDEEKLLVIKTAVHLFPALSRAIRELHPYELPEAVMLPLSDTSPEIQEWLESCLAEDPGGG